MITANQQRQKGLSAWQYFVAAAAQYPDNFSMSYDQSVKYMDGINQNFFQFLGRSILSDDNGNSFRLDPYSDNLIALKMTALADNNEGKLPTHLSEFLKAFDTVDVPEWSWTNSVVAAVKAVGETGSDVATAVGTFSTAVVSNTASSIVTLTKYLPWFLIGGAVLYLVVITGGPTKALNSLKGAVAK